MSKQLFSLRMRAAEGGSHKEGGRHISGAERIITPKEIDNEVSSLIKRAQEHSQGNADYINLTLELLKSEEIEKLTSLPITTIKVDNYSTGRKEVKRLLLKLGIEQKGINKALGLLANGPNPDRENMRGAILMNSITGERLEPDQYRGIRASRMDYKRETKMELIDLLKRNNLNQTHLPDALALATKVLSCPSIIAELCCSDDPNYTAGYVASKKFGYCRFPYLKPDDVARGGRVFFLSSLTNFNETLTYIQKRPVLINDLDFIIEKYSSTNEMLKVRGEDVGGMA
ncbi:MULTISPECIES: 6-carboxyhexanoate--CoA ligase [unclassified Candidatus Frackibacter]|uniref:6-carboxyhexanoate--CoA ligase n=1 Tax=unclassified Candidatus Frackibacter TaxID=2648818 RepID=UPI00087F3529|nr:MULTISPECIES: 6-carboxyhexanoate--CoA ligase [unclassified Candidatus Frackibacter]SDC17926.1 6-carboxyhexanoate--CoA ligase [Candidatus Frackibacter sp. WG11]SEM44134.1 6-carboxyhexanoate--CoA ligase [Candidatus Frackibacter sp. WG12]SFL46643.1 6-carboxyhexanoate--CoA ligase [Candidatus Frackibacter sp. WG13]